MRVIESDFFDEKKDDRFAYESIESRQFVAVKLASSPFHQRIDDGEKNAADELIQQNQTDGAKKSTGIDLSARENVMARIYVTSFVLSPENVSFLGFCTV